MTAPREAVRVGVALDLRNPPPWRRDWVDHYGQSLEWIQEAEHVGLDTVWLSEHHLFEDGYLSQPLVFAAAIAAKTSTIRIGTAALLAPIRHPLHIAEQAALVDVLSGGRFELGVGSGYVIPEFESFGIPFDMRNRKLAETVDAVRSYWRGGLLLPAPVQPDLPIWIGAQSEIGARRAGRLGAGLLSGDRRLLPAYLDGLTIAGLPIRSASMAALSRITLSADPENDWPRLRQHLAYQWDTYRRYGAQKTGRPTPEPVDPDRLRLPGPNGEEPRGELLTPDQAAVRIGTQLDGLPVKDVYFWLSIAGMADDLVAQHLQLLGRQLAPTLREFFGH